MECIEISKPFIKSLQRISEANQVVEAGAGISPSDFIPLCRYHSRSVATKLKEILLGHGVAVRTVTTRMYVNFEVAFKDRLVAARLLEDFRQSHVDLRPRAFSRDYDVVILIAFVTIVLAVGTAVVQQFVRLMPLCILVTGITLSIVVERIHRHDRLHDGYVFTLKELLILTTLFALNIGVWRWC